jgi:Ca-activated chloride channel homolog
MKTQRFFGFLLSIGSILFFILSAQSQTRLVTGKVTDSADGSVLPGVTVTVKGTSIGTSTDANGRYQIKVPIKNNQLTFSYLGFKTATYKLNKKDTLDVALIQDEQSLSEALVTGYSTRVKKGGAYDKEVLLPRQASGTYAKSETKTQTSRFVVPLIEHDDSNTENYSAINENTFKSAKNEPLTTFSTDVDKASYSNVRRFIKSGNLPHKDVVRIEEMVNYFDYDYAQPQGKQPVNIHTEISDSPWNKGLKLLHIGLQAKKIPTDKLPASNLVFLIDVSGSMNESNKLPLVTKAFKLLTDQLREQDRVAIVVYAGAAGVVLPSTTGNHKTTIKDALDKLEAGGSTAGGAGIQLAYKLAQEHFIKNGNNRVILATDGDFNVGASSDAQLQRLIEEKRQTGVFLSVLGFGMGNYKDNRMEILADKGNGNYAYIDNALEAQKVFVKEFGGTLFTVAKDVKLQLEFNPKYVQAYRLIGYENRALNNEDFEDDKKDAGDMGSGHTVTAIYEIVPTGVESQYLKKLPKLKYQETVSTQTNSNEMCTLRIRYKDPQSEQSELIETVVRDQHKALEQASENFRFAVSVAGFGLLLRDSEYKGGVSYGMLVALAKNALGKDTEGYRAEFLHLMKATKTLKKQEAVVRNNDDDDE